MERWTASVISVIEYWGFCSAKPPISEQTQQEKHRMDLWREHARYCCLGHQVLKNIIKDMAKNVSEFWGSPPGYDQQVEDWRGSIEEKQVKL